MSTTTERAQTTDASHEQEGGRAVTLSDASLPESLAVLATGVVPALVRGLFSPRRRAMKLLTAANADGRAIAVLSKVRQKHDGDGVKLLGGRIVVLWGEPAIREVLDKSSTTYLSDGGAKAKGMSHFQPDALTLSHGEDWRDRRQFNEAVLASKERVHPAGRRFLAVVADECRRLTLDSTLTWTDWEQLFDRITLRVIFGDEAREDQHLTELLERLMSESNRLIALKPSERYYDLQAGLERYVREPGTDSLVARFAQAPQSDRTRIIQQIPHWMFAMRDTLGANAYRALAAIVADRGIEAQVRTELETKDLTDPAVIDGLTYLEGCLQEAMRLWPTTPLLAREVSEDATLGGERLDEGTQVMLLNVFNHRAPEGVDDAGRMRPERWSDQPTDYRFNHLSNGTQDCPGGALVLFLGKAVLGQMISRHRLTLERPELPSGEELPEMLDFFATEFRVQPA